MKFKKIAIIGKYPAAIESSEMNSQLIDLIEYFDDPIIYISNALAPALVTAVQILDEDENTEE